MAVQIQGLTEEQQVQHEAVLNAAAHNLNLVRDQIASLKHAVYDDLLGTLDRAADELQHVRGA